MIRFSSLCTCPVQSGDDEVLDSMRRFYSVADFKKIVGAFRARFADVTLATDVICGFPGESREAFERTLRLIEEVRPDVVNVSKFLCKAKDGRDRNAGCVCSFV